MKIVAVREVEDCFDNTVSRDVVFDRPTDLEFIVSLGRIGRLRYHHSLARPFWRLQVDGLFTLKGIQRNNVARLVFKKGHYAESIEMLVNAVNQYSNQHLPLTTLRIDGFPADDEQRNSLEIVQQSATENPKPNPS